MKRFVLYVLLISFMLATFLTIAFVVGGRSFTRTATREIQASPEVVLHTLTDSTLVQKWMQDVDHVSELKESIDGQQVRKIEAGGVLYEQQISIDGRCKLIVSYSDNYSEVEDEFTLTETTRAEAGIDGPIEVGRTELKRVIRYDYAGAYRIIAPFIRNAIDRRMKIEMSGIKRASEPKPVEPVTSA